MAQGDLLTFEEFRKNIGDGSHDMDNDTFSVILITTLPVLGQASPDRVDYTEVTAGGGYSTGGIALTGVTWTEAAGVATFDSSLAPTWTAAAGSPTNIVAALIVNDTHAGTNDAIAFIDMTVDAGTTPISLVAGNVSITFNASGLFTLS
jgi:hypothetical protein